MFAQQLSYVGVGPVFATQTKKDTKAVLGVQHFHWVVENSPAPVVGIGGLSESNIAVLRRSRAMALALCSAFFSAADPKQTSQKLLEKLKP